MIYCSPQKEDGLKGILLSAARRLPPSRFVDILFSISLYAYRHKYIPNYTSGKTFNERLMGIKLGNEAIDPLRQYVSDKEHLKDYVRGKAGDQYVVNTFKVLNTPAEVNQYDFPERCAIKPTHMSGEYAIKEKAEDIVDPTRITNWFDSNYYQMNRERNYRYLKPRIVVEELLITASGGMPNDYKVFCFHGKPMFIQVDRGRFGVHTRNFYTAKWEPLTFSFASKNRTTELDPKPANLQEMMKLAATLSKDFSFIRVDLYLVDDQIKVGELTSFPVDCRGDFRPVEADTIIGKLFDDPDEKVLASLIGK